jgi:hypothetical protein
MNTRLKGCTQTGVQWLPQILLATLTACGGGGGGGGTGNSASSMPPAITVAGTAATGKALANVAISINCVQGSAAVTADANGNYSATLNAIPPCLISATAGTTELRSTAFAGGTFNVTPETDLLLSYLAAQSGTTESGLVAGFPANAGFQQVLASQTDVLAAESAVVASLQLRYSVSLLVSSFLTTSFVVGQPGVDSDLTALLAAGAIDANGEPDSAAVTLMATSGAAHPIAIPSGSGAGGGTGNGTGSGGAAGMM